MIPLLLAQITDTNPEKKNQPFSQSTSLERNNQFNRRRKNPSLRLTKLCQLSIARANAIFYHLNFKFQ